MGHYIINQTQILNKVAIFEIIPVIIVRFRRNGTTCILLDEMGLDEKELDKMG